MAFLYTPNQLDSTFERHRFLSYYDTKDLASAGVHRATNIDAWDFLKPLQDLELDLLTKACCGGLGFIAKNETGGALTKGTPVAPTGKTIEIEGDDESQTSLWSLYGPTPVKMYWALTKSGTTVTVKLYSDPDNYEELATGSRTGDGAIVLAPTSSSGIGGGVTVAYTEDDSDSENIIFPVVLTIIKATAANVPARAVLAADMADDAVAFVPRFADIGGLDTSGFTAVGDKVYLGVTDGTLAVTAPSGADQLVQEVGFVTNKDATNGSIRTTLNVVKYGTSGLQNKAVTAAKIGSEAATVGQVLQADGSGAASFGDFTVPAHASNHESGGADAIKLDDLAAPDDNTDLNAGTTAHGLLLKATAPAAGLRNVVAIDNGETMYKNTALFDTTNPENIGTAGPGDSLLASRRNHVHAVGDNTLVAAKSSFTGQYKILGRESAGAGAGEEIAGTAAGLAMLKAADAAAQNLLLNPVAIKTADYTVLAGDSGKIFTNEGAAVQVELTLPTPSAGATFSATQQLTGSNLGFGFKAASGHTIVDDEKTGYLFWMRGVGQSVKLVGLNTTQWAVQAKNKVKKIAQCGYFAGGYSGANVTTCDRVTFSTGVTAAHTAGNLSQARYGLAGLSDGNQYGYFAGGNTGANVTTCDRVTFSTGVTAAHTAGNLSQARYGLAWLSDFSV